MLASKHNPNGTSPHFDNVRLESLISAYQTGTNPAALAEIVTLAQARVLTLIRFRKTARYCAEGELLSDVNFKLIRAIDKFDPAKGSAFTFVSQVVMNVLCTSVTNARRASAKYTGLDDDLIDTLPAKSEDRTVADDIAHRIKAGARTTLTDPVELSTQRWYIESFTADGFESRRHECANAAMSVHNVSHGRSRELYDLTMLEVRRVLYDDLKGRQPISAGRLLGTRFAWMACYRPLLSESEFTKFVILARNLSPFVLVLIDPESRSRRLDRNPTIGRQNLLWIINGHPSATPLFPGNASAALTFSDRR
jgi:hypothetical protein